MNATATLFTSLAIGALSVGLLSMQAHAAGNDSETTPTCKKGEIYDEQAKKCVKQEGSAITDENRAHYAYALAKTGRYAEALIVLDGVANQNDPEVLNYRGYATRKLGRTDEGIAYYLRSVAEDPHYAKVREYLGEAYVIKGRLDLAKEQLAAIQSICGLGCEEYRDLDEVIRSPSAI